MTSSLFMLLFIISALPSLVIACVALFKREPSKANQTSSVQGE